MKIEGGRYLKEGFGLEFSSWFGFSRRIGAFSFCLNVQVFPRSLGILMVDETIQFHWLVHQSVNQSPTHAGCRGEYIFHVSHSPKTMNSFTHSPIPATATTTAC
jgi:hypothetical protein